MTPSTTIVLAYLPDCIYVPAAVPARVGLSVQDDSVGHKEFPLGAEDDDVVHCGGQGEEEHFELKAHAEEDSTCNEGEDTAEYRVLRERERDGIRSQT